jgi:hypothetical protein
MIVFPLRRSVGFRAATAASRVETLPILVRNRPSLTRWTISLSWARSGSTKKSTAIPLAGRASAGSMKRLASKEMAAQRELRPGLHQDYHQTRGEHADADKEHGFLSKSERQVSFCESHGQRKQKYQHNPNQ